MSHAIAQTSNIGTDQLAETKQQVVANRTGRALAWQIAMLLPLPVCVVMSLLPSAGVPWQTVSGVLLIALLGVSSVTDLKSHKIPNWATYPAVLWALFINLYASTLGTAEINQTLGAVGIQNCLLGLAVPFFFMLVIFSFTGGGAGDVKLTAAIGAFLGLSMATDAILFSFIFAGGFALIRAIMLKGPIALLVLAWRTIGGYLLPLWILPPSNEQKEFLRQPMPLGPSFALGTAIVLLQINVMDVVNSLSVSFGG